MKTFSTLTITLISFMVVMPFTVLAEKQGFVVFKTPPGLKGKDANDKNALPSDVWNTLDVLLTAGRKEFLAEGSTSTTDVSTSTSGTTDGNGNRHLRGVNDERHLPTVCPNPELTCRQCQYLDGNLYDYDAICYTCPYLCRRRSLVEQLFPRSLQSSDFTTTTTHVNPMVGYKTCKQVKDSDVQDDISDEKAKKRVKKFATGFDRSSVKVYICED